MGKLTAVAIKTALAKPGVYSDGDGLSLRVDKRGGAYWQLRVQRDGKRQDIGLGSTKVVTLAQARQLADDKRRAVKVEGRDPVKEKKAEKARRAIETGNTFGAIADEYLEKRRREGLADVTLRKSQWLLDQVTSTLGDMPVADITPADILVPLRKLEKVGNLETARRCLQLVSRVLKYAVASARLDSNPARDLAGALTTPIAKHHAAITDPAELGRLLRDIDAYTGQPATVLALQLAPHLFQRPGEVRQMRWEALDLDKAIWRRDDTDMKKRRAHDVPLSPQVVAILRRAQTLTGNTGYVFPALGKKDTPLSENTINAALRRMSYPSDVMSSHGFRATASTLLNGTGKFRPEVIEFAQSRVMQGTAAIYNRQQYWTERVELAGWWSNYLDELKESAKAARG